MSSPTQRCYIFFVMCDQAPKKITEIKCHLDGREERFGCELVSMEPGEAVIRYLWHRDRPFRDGPIYLPAGDTITWAFYWEGRHFLVYKFMAADGKLFGHRLDICEDVKISSEKIIWTDLVLDLWVAPDHKIHLLDEEEVKMYKRRGLLAPRQLKIIERTKHYLLKNHKIILGEVTRAVRQ